MEITVGGLGGAASPTPLPPLPLKAGVQPLGCWPDWRGPEGVGSESDSAPGTLPRSSGLHAPALPLPPRAPRQRPRPPLSPLLSRPPSGPCSLNIPRALPLPLSLFWQFQSCSRPLEQLRPLMGDKAVKAAREAPARPALARPAPACPPGSLGQAARARQGNAQRARLTRQSKLS